MPNPRLELLEAQRPVLLPVVFSEHCLHQRGDFSLAGGEPLRLERIGHHSSQLIPCDAAPAVPVEDAEDISQLRAQVAMEHAVNCGDELGNAERLAFSLVEGAKQVRRLRTVGARA